MDVRWPYPLKMDNMRLIFLLLVLFSLTSVKAQHPDSIPEYADFVAELNSGNFDIDYREFRISYLYSEEFTEKSGSDYAELLQDFYKYIRKEKPQKAIDACQKMLKIDYTSMVAHKHIELMAKVIGDTALYNKHHHIEFELFKSIVHTGDGKTCESSWEVTQVEEEYFVLRVIGAEQIEQSLVGMCDQMDFIRDGKRETLYFGLQYVFESYGLESKK